jgi:hypothetical protein
VLILELLANLGMLWLSLLAIVLCSLVDVRQREVDALDVEIPVARLDQVLLHRDGIRVVGRPEAKLEPFGCIGRTRHAVVSGKAGFDGAGGRCCVSRPAVDATVSPRGVGRVAPGALAFLDPPRTARRREIFEILGCCVRRSRRATGRIIGGPTSHETREKRGGESARWHRGGRSNELGSHPIATMQSPQRIDVSKMTK